MNSNHNLDDFLIELNASLSNDSSDAMMRRINTERMIKLLANELIDEHKADNIRILSDSRISDQVSADYLFQVDDYDIRVEIVDSPDGKTIIDLEKLQSCLKLLEMNPSTAVIVVVWSNDQLSSLELPLSRLLFFIHNPKKIQDLQAEIHPLSEVISSIIQRQKKGWNIDKSAKQESFARKRDIYSLFSEKIVTAIKNEAKRRYYIEERSIAASSYPVEQETKILLSILRDALLSKPVKDLQANLINLPHRGNL